MKQMSDHSRKADVVIAGGGASGLAAAIELGLRAPGLSVLVIEKLEEPGKKLRATGSGRCNITNTKAPGYDRIMSFFDEIGLMTRSYESGLVYPYSESASDAAELLVERALSLGVRFACNEELMAVKHLPSALASEPVKGSDNVFLLESVYKDRDGLQSVSTQAGFVILAMGGKSGPTFGTIGDGYRIARNLGHSIVTPVPALTGIECEEWSEEHQPCALSLAGTRTRGRVALYKSCGGAGDGRAAGSVAANAAGGVAANAAGGDAGRIELFSEEGEIQFTRYGLSGICVFNMTRNMRYDRREGESLEDFLVTADLCPDRDIRDFIKGGRGGAFADQPAGGLLRGVLKEPLADYVIKSAKIGPLRTIGSLSDDEIDAIASFVHSCEFHPSGIRGWKDSQVTMGGVSLDELDERSSESRLVKGVYITGELADRDFPCGGFNLSNAWITGLAAADDIAAKTR